MRNVASTSSIFCSQESLDPLTLYSERFPCTVISDGACCTCIENLFSALEQLDREGILSKRIRIVAGRVSELPVEKDTFTIAVGGCVSRQTDVDCHINACPPSSGRIYQTIARALRK